MIETYVLTAAGFVAFLSGIVTAALGVGKQLQATRENTAAVKELADSLTPLREIVAGHEARLNVIEPLVLDEYLQPHRRPDVPGGRPQFRPREA